MDVLKINDDDDDKGFNYLHATSFNIAENPQRFIVCDKI